MATKTYRLQDLKQFTGSLSASDFLLVKIKKRVGMVGDEDMKVSLSMFLNQVSQNYYPMSGGVLDGDLEIRKGNAIKLQDVQSVPRVITGFDSNNNLLIGNASLGITVVTNSNLSVKRGANTYEVYHTGNLPSVTKVDNYRNAGFVGATHAIDMGRYTDYQITLQNPQTTLSFASGYVVRSVETLTLLITQGSGSNKITWPSNVKWANGYPPTLSYNAGKTDIITLISYDLGATWLGLMTATGVSK